MAYEILKTNGTVLTSIPDGQLVSSYGGLTLMGHKYPAIGTILNTDLVHIVENFASTTPPTNPLIGQLWYDSVSNTINFWNGNEFNSISVITSAETAPLSPIGGDEWFNTITNQLYIWSGNQWILVGPPGASGGGTEGLVVQSINVNGNQIYYIELYANNQLLGIISTEEILQPGIDGFGNIRPGLNFVISPTLGLASGGIFNINELTIGDSDQIDITLDSKDNLVLALNENNNGGNILIAATNGNTPSEISSLIGTVYVNNLVAIGSLSGNVPGADGHILFNNHGITDALLNLYASTDRSSINIPTILNVNNINANSEIINGPLSVSGSSTTNTLTVNLTANISTLDVTGTTTTSTLDVTGTTTTSTLDVTGNATIVGPASFQHPVTFNYSSANAFILPPSAGIIGQAVTSNGNGTTSWSNIAGAKSLSPSSTSFTGTNTTGSVAGYQILPGGLILQWGTVTGSGGFSTPNGSFNYLIAFPNTVLSVIGSILSASQDGFVMFSSYSSSAANFKLHFDADISGWTFNWFAVGF